jgi:hypothetical protein
MGQKFTWVNVKAETSRTLTDVTLTARFLAVARLRRQTATAAKLWISQILTRKALLEDPKLGTPISLPESLYLDILVGQMSAQEATVFENCPSIGDNLLEKDWTGKNRYTLDKLKKAIDACSNPPYFRGVKTPITDLLDQSDPKPVKEKRDQAVKKDVKKTPPKPSDKSVDKTHLSRRPNHEQLAKFPDGLKRPDLTATVDGNKIASEAQRQLYDDVKRGNCSRCHKGGHNRKDCKGQVSSNGNNVPASNLAQPKTLNLPLSTSNLEKRTLWKSVLLLSIMIPMRTNMNPSFTTTPPCPTPTIPTRRTPHAPSMTMDT